MRCEPLLPLQHNLMPAVAQDQVAMCQYLILSSATDQLKATPTRHEYRHQRILNGHAARSTLAHRHADSIRQQSHAVAAISRHSNALCLDHALVQGTSRLGGHTMQRTSGMRERHNSVPQLGIDIQLQQAHDAHSV